MSNWIRWSAGWANPNLYVRTLIRRDLANALIPAEKCEDLRQQSMREIANARLLHQSTNERLAEALAAEQASKRSEGEAWATLNSLLNRLDELPMDAQDVLVRVAEVDDETDSAAEPVPVNPVEGPQGNLGAPAPFRASPDSSSN